ncbi:Hypothetical protein A7982_08200 [Minicystis rosea]|nr:Hypothetical protein A7982_08200 [Minicystis rosea]
MGVGLGPGLLITLATSSWSTVGGVWTFRRFGADWALASLVGGLLGLLLGLVIQVVIFEAADASK